MVDVTEARGRDEPGGALPVPRALEGVGLTACAIATGRRSTSLAEPRSARGSQEDPFCRLNVRKSSGLFDNPL